MLTQQEIAKIFKTEQGQPMMLTEGQVELFNIIFQRKYPRVHVMAHTRYGKSLVIALAILMRVSTFAEKWAIVAPSEKKAQIIMGYIIDHVFDNDYFRAKFQVGKEESEERIRRERNKKRINFLHPDGTLGEVYIVSADNRNKQSSGDSLMGFGASSVVLDESSLIDDDIEAKIFRMLGDSMDNFYCEVGNPFRRNHFHKALHNPAYHTINIDYEQGMKEGRITQDFLNEVKRKPFYSILYENKFPEAEAVDNKGWSFLITETEFERAGQIIEESAWFGDRRMGVDVARGGGNFNVWVLRTTNYAKVLAKNQDGDLMSVVGTTIRLANEWKVDMQNVFVDDTGVGAGVSDRLREQRYQIHAVKLGESPTYNNDPYTNRRSQDYWRMKKWLNEGGKLCMNDDWSELTQIKYRADDSQGRIKIMSKDDMRKYGIESPDVADALMLTFDTVEIPIKNRDELLKKKMMRLQRPSVMRAV